MKRPEPQPAVATAPTGLRYNAGKPRYDLVPPAFNKALAEHFAAGAAKYDDRNWEKGLDLGDVLRAATSHITEYNLGHKFDVDPTMPLGYLGHHLIAAAWNLVVAFELERRKAGTDSRPRAQFDNGGSDDNHS